VPAPGVLANDDDFDPLTAVLVGGPSQGTLTLQLDGSFQYQATATAGGTDSFTYRASDGVAESAPQTVTITILPGQGGAPEAVDDAYVVKKRRHRPHLLLVLANDSAGPNGGGLRIIGFTQPRLGRVSLAPGGRGLVFQAPKRFRGVLTFTYTIQNASGATDTATVTVTVKKRGWWSHGGGDDDDDDDRGHCDGGDHDHRED
jgi:VCBS repeat-containing protein